MSQPTAVQVPSRPLTIVVPGTRGGTGKTVTSTNLAVAFHQNGYRTGFADLCDTRVGSEFFGLFGSRPDRSIGAALLQEPLGGLATFGIAHPRLAELVVYTNNGEVQSADFEDRLRVLDGFEFRLRQLVDQLAGDLDVLILDTHAGTTLLGDLALLAADIAIIPCRPEGPYIGPAAKLYARLTRWAQANPATAPVIAGVLLTDVDPRLRSYRRTVATAEAGGMRLLDIQIPKTIRLVDVYGAGVPFIAANPDQPIGFLYRDLASHLYQLHRDQRVLDAAHSPELTA